MTTLREVTGNLATLNLAKARAFELAQARGLARSFNLKLDLAMNCALQVEIETIQDLDVDLELACTLDLDLYSTLYRAFDGDLELDRALALSCVRSINQATTTEYNYPHDLSGRFDKIAQLSREKRVEEAWQLAQQLAQDAGWVKVQRTARLIADLLEIRLSRSFLKLSQAHRGYILHLSEYLRDGYTQLEKEQNVPDKYKEEIEQLQQVVAWRKMIEARIEGRLPTWEGIRIIRIKRGK